MLKGNVSVFRGSVNVSVFRGSVNVSVFRGLVRGTTQRWFFHPVPSSGSSLIPGQPSFYRGNGGVHHGPILREESLNDPSVLSLSLKG